MSYRRPTPTSCPPLKSPTPDAQPLPSSNNCSRTPDPSRGARCHPSRSCRRRDAGRARARARSPSARPPTRPVWTPDVARAGRWRSAAARRSLGVSRTAAARATNTMMSDIEMSWRNAEPPPPHRSPPNAPPPSLLRYRLAGVQLGRLHRRTHRRRRRRWIGGCMGSSSLRAVRGGASPAAAAAATPPAVAADGNSPPPTPITTTTITTTTTRA